MMIVVSPGFWSTRTLQLYKLQQEDQKLKRLDLDFENMKPEKIAGTY
jgi:hypothetical protein